MLRDESRAYQRPRDLAERIVRLEASLQTLYSKHRGTIGGREVSNNEIDMILRDSTDLAERRAAWDASKEIGPKAAVQVRELAALRNEAARGLGYRDHFAMSLELQELDEGWLFGLLDRLESLLADPWAAEKAAIDDAQRARLGDRRPSRPLRPWDYADPFFQDAAARRRPTALEAALAALDPLARRRAYFGALGDPIEEILARSDLYPRGPSTSTRSASRSTAATTCASSRNVEPGERWLATMLHELGHGVYDIAIERDLPWLLRRHAHIFATEAIAMLHGRRHARPDVPARLLRPFAAELAAPFNRAFIRRGCTC